MNFIEKKAQTMVKLYFNQKLGNHKKVLEIVDKDLSNVDNSSDRLLYLTIVMEANDLAYHEHLKECINPTECTTNLKHEQINYYLQQELKRIGIEISNDSFTREEKQILVACLDKELEDLKKIKVEHELIYNELKEEIDDLKKWFLIGKKNWIQLAVGKFSEMVASGIVSASISEPIINALKTLLPKLLN